MMPYLYCIRVKLRKRRSADRCDRGSGSSGPLPFCFGLQHALLMSLKLYLLRHGQTDLSREDSFCGSGLDPELTAEGLEMAQAFAAAYRAKSWRAIYSSSLRRAIASAQPLCDALAMSLQVRADLNEIGYGKWEGLTRETVEREYHDDYVS